MYKMYYLRMWPSGAQITVHQYKDGSCEIEERRYFLQYHPIRSTSGYEWGKLTVGAMDLSMAILTDYKSEKLAKMHYKRFTENVLGRHGESSTVSINQQHIELFLLAEEARRKAELGGQTSETKKEPENLPDVGLIEPVDYIIQNENGVPILRTRRERIRPFTWNTQAWHNIEPLPQPEPLPDVPPEDDPNIF